MNGRRITWTIVALFVLTTIAVTLGTSDGQTQQIPKRSETAKNNDSIVEPSPQLARMQDQDGKETFPQIDYHSNPLEGETRKTAKYEKSMQILSTSLFKDTDSLSGSRWYTGLQPIPVDASSPIVSGVVEDVRAHITTNKNTVYTTIRVRIDKVYKNITNIDIGNSVEVEREGGIVRYPSGFKFWHRLAGQRIPRTGSEYLFFLSNDFPLLGLFKDDLYLLAAYDISSESIIPLDDLGDLNGAFSRYKGKSKHELISDLTESLK